MCLLQLHCLLQAIYVVIGMYCMHGTLDVQGAIAHLTSNVHCSVRP